MKRLALIFCLLPLLCLAHGPGDFWLSKEQTLTNGTTHTTVYLTPVATSLWGFDAGKNPITLTVIPESMVTGLTSDLAAKASLASPTFTGTVTGTFSGNLTGNVTGSAGSFTGNLSGDVTGTQGATAIAATTVTSKLLTGYSSTTGGISASDSILTAIEKLNGNLAGKLSSTNVGVTITDLTSGGNAILTTNDGGNSPTIQFDTLQSGFVTVLTDKSTLSAGRIAGTLGALNGGNLTSLNASNISSGTLNNSRLPSTISQTTLTASGKVTGALFGGSGSAPTGVKGSGAGSTGSPSITITGSDWSHTVSITTGTGTMAANATLVTVTLNSTAYGAAPGFTMTPVNSKAALLTGATNCFILDASTTYNSGTVTYVIETGTTGLATSTTYVWRIITTAP